MTLNSTATEEVNILEKGKGSVSVTMSPCQVSVFLAFTSGKCAEKMVGGRRKADIWKALLLESFLLSIAGFLTLATTSQGSSETASTSSSTTTKATTVDCFFFRKVDENSVVPGWRWHMWQQHKKQGDWLTSLKRNASQISFAGFAMNCCFLKIRLNRKWYNFTPLFYSWVQSKSLCIEEMLVNFKTL